MDSSPAYLDGVAREIAETIEAASIGSAEWRDVCGVYLRAFPGSFAAVINQNFEENRTEFFENAGLEQAFVDSYADYYASINPWNEFWKSMPNGACLVANKTLPTRLLKHTEFYTDWMRRTGDFDGAVGLKVSISSTNIVHLPVHYPLSLSHVYDVDINWVSSAQAAVLSRAVKFAQWTAARSEKISASSVVGIEDRNPVVVLDGEMTVVDANESAVQSFRNTGVLRNRYGKLNTSERQSTVMLKHAVRSLASSAASRISKLSFQANNAIWVASLARLPIYGRASLIMPRRLVVVKFRNLTAIQKPWGLEALAPTFALTLAETRLCQYLYEGDSLTLAADKLSWTYETARSTLKSVFAKTNISRQSELVRLLDRLLSD
ncbi:helix-turn-helix transcriptional regulator [Roseibium aggregatum]|uniref:HTH luxR-type domain-containing protein n=1 Tax=Roseibium aggregatum TaxID=187304 RepID=A0A0M6XWM8_9HYPH|nr:helix-turn-helix transcriptional regulator [Roseibium aggregatum]CTQ42251.1 hypothetical protein LAL4801_00676 [Roseibium aggregatum]